VQLVFIGSITFIVVFLVLLQESITVVVDDCFFIACSYAYEVRNVDWLLFALLVSSKSLLNRNVTRIDLFMLLTALLDAWPVMRTR